MLPVLQKQRKERDLEECRRKLRELEVPRSQKAEYVGILIFWLKNIFKDLRAPDDICGISAIAWKERNSFKSKNALFSKNITKRTKKRMPKK